MTTLTLLLAAQVATLSACAAQTQPLTVISLGIIVEPTTTFTTTDGDTIGPFITAGGFQPEDGVYSTLALAQNYGTLYNIERVLRLTCPEDVNRDGVVDFDDITAILSAWTKECRE